MAINAFGSYIEPYFRHFSEEGLAFLRERGDRVTPYIIPKLGRHCSEQWAEEDGANLLARAVGAAGAMGTASSASASASPAATASAAASAAAFASPAPATNSSAARPANALRGWPDGLCEDREDASCARCCRVCWPPTCPKICPTPPTPTPPAVPTLPPAKPPRHRPPRRTYATSLPNSADFNWEIPTGKADYAMLDERIRREMVYVGLLNPSQGLDFANSKDDEVSARLRALQRQQRQQSAINGARKARIAEKLKEQLAC